jgi:hypothetical protein
MAYVETDHDRTTRLCLTLVGCDRTDISLSRLDAKTNERPALLKRCPNMDICLNIEMRCGRWRNGEAYQHYRRRSVTARHAICHPSASHGVPTLSGHVLTLWIERLQLSHGPIVFPSPVNGSKAPMERFVRATRSDAHTGVSAGCGQREPLLFALFGFSESKFGPKGF